jgi:hypothetical protein
MIKRRSILGLRKKNAMEVSYKEYIICCRGIKEHDPGRARSTEVNDG